MRPPPPNQTRKTRLYRSGGESPKCLESIREPTPSWWRNVESSLLPLSPAEFYLSDLPSALQQGDIIAGVPLILFPPLAELVLVRSTHHRLKLEHLEAGDVSLYRENAVADAFEGGNEYAAVSVQRSYALLITATCDLEGKDVWAFLPLYPIEGAGLDAGNLRAGKYSALFALPNHEYFDPCFVDFSDLRPVRSGHVGLKDRIASLTREAQHEIQEKYLRSYGRPWGFAAGEVIEPLGKYETGKFRCARCNVYDVSVPEKTLPPGSAAPACENCLKINKAAQWYPLTKHKK
jgi:hypothetical protein